MSAGLDVGTSFLIKATEEEDGIHYREFRDAFYRVRPATPIASKMLKKGIANLAHFQDTDGSFVIVGQDAIEKAIERHQSALRPMSKGVLSPKEPDARRVLKFIFSQLVGKPTKKGEVLVYSIPAEPIDQNEEDFNTGYHEDVLRRDLNELGWDARALNEAEAICYSELEDDDYTGVSISCLIPGTKIYTDHGILNIEDVQEGYKVITHKGRWRPITKVIKKQFDGLSTSIQLHGYSDITKDYQFVDNHELYVYKDNVWQWIGCEEVEEGDIVGEPIIKQDKSRKSIPGITICEQTTCSKQYVKTRIQATSDVHRLIGYFLGDGSISERGNGIQFDFHIDEKENISDVQQILLKNFKKESTLYQKDENCIRIKCYSKGIASWFKNHLYDKNKEKIYPWDISRLQKSHCINLLAGLIRSDGWYTDKGFAFGNSSTSLIILVKQLCSRAGIAASISYRSPRKSILNDEKIIKGTKEEWTISTGQKLSGISLTDLIKSVNCENSQFVERLFIEENFCCSRISKIEYSEYNGIVYDLQVEEDHSFSGPYLTIHNCGSGMHNICVMSSGEPVLAFSVCRSGDWIDRMAAQSTGQADSIVQYEKENGQFTVGQESDNPILSAVSAYYVRVIDYVVQYLSARLSKSTDLPKFTVPIPIVIAGGTSLANGYLEVFETKLKQYNFPLAVKEIRYAKDPLRAVARGLLICSSL